MNNRFTKILAAALAVLLVFCVTSCKKENTTKKAESIAVYVPGVMSGSPVYEMLASGVQKSVEQYNANVANQNEKVSVTIIEAGTNQAEWGNKITAVAATGEYTMIISSNPSLPELIEPLTVQFPSVKFLVLDAFLEGNDHMATVRYNQREQAYMAGYAAGLVTVADSADMPFANEAKKVALIAAQEYPVMNNIIYPSFAEGAHAVDPEIQVDFKVVGNWYDASKGAELARACYDEGVDVILPICGGAAQGVIAAAQELGFYVTWFDDNGFAKAPGHVISSATLEQERMAMEVTSEYLAGKTVMGTAKTVGMKEGYVRFVNDDPLYESSVAESVRAKLDAEYNRIMEGKLLLPAPKQ